MMRFGRRPILRDGRGNQGSWFYLMLLALIPLYWVFARYLERVDLSVTIGQWWQTTIQFGSPPRPIIFILEMLHPRVLRHLIPIVVGWLLAEGAAVGLIQTLYDLPDRHLASLFLGRLRSSGAAHDTLSVSGKTLEAERENSVLLRVGGPGRIRIGDTEAAVTELNGRFHRVLGPGRHQLGRFEYLYAILDLRKQERVASAALATTRDGIDIKTDITVTFRISSGGESITQAKPYPYDEDAVRRAAYSETVLPDHSVAAWDAIPLGLATAKLVQIVARYELDQLLYPHSSTSNPRKAIRDELERLVRVALQDFGIELTGLQIGQIELPRPVIEQYIEYWQAHWETQSQLTRADGAVFELQEIEIARVEAEVTMIRAIVEGVQRARVEGGSGAAQEVVALRLVEALEKVAAQSQQALPLPSSLVPQLRSFREQLTSQGLTLERD